MKKIQKSRKAFALFIETAVVLILAVVFLVGGTALITRLNSKLDEDVINQACYQSVWRNSELRVPLVEAQSAKIHCPTKYITIHRGFADIEYESNPVDNSRGNEAVKLPDVIFTDQDRNKCENADDPEACMFRNINKLFADEMARCWANFHKGQRRVFSVYEKERQCIVCSVLIFDNEMIAEYEELGLIGFNNLEDENYNLDVYMRNNNNLKYTGDKTYYEFTLDLLDEVNMPYYDYSVDGEYTVLFIALNENQAKNVFKDAWEKVKHKSISYETEEGNFVNTNDFVPNKDVNTRCDTWA